MLLRFNLALIGLLYFLAAGAGFLSPSAPNPVPASPLPYAPPTDLNWDLSFHPWQLQQGEDGFGRQFVLNGKRTCHVELLGNGYGYELFGVIPLELHLLVSPDCPGDFHPLGTDNLGRDHLARLLHGLRPSLLTGLIGILIAFPLGIAYGTVAGYYGGALGDLMMRVVEVILSLPSLYLLVILAALLPADLGNLERLSLITAILAFIGWAGLARVVRGQALSVREREYVQAAKMLGQPDWLIMLREIVPQLSSYLIVAATLSFPGYVLGETALSFLGLGVNQPDASLGNLLAEGRQLANVYLRPWLAVGPAVVLIVLTWSCNGIGDGLRDRFDPKGKGRSR